MCTHYFLGAISPKGFFSYYPELIDLKQANSVYIIKGGPGSGKSSFMRKVIGIVTAERPGETEYIHCSSDPDSLDAVVFSDMGAAIVDGTPPHVVEPKYAGVTEHYLSLYDHTDFLGIKAQKETLFELIDANAACYKRVYGLLEAKKAILDDMLGLLITDGTMQKISRRANGIIAREIGKKSVAGKNGSIKKRFLNGFTPQGAICRYDTADALCTRIYDLSDNYGTAHLLLKPIADAAVNAGYDIVACYNPMTPDTELAHVLIPELKLGFVTSSMDMKYPETENEPRKPYRRIRLDACLSADKYREHRLRLRFLRKTERALHNEVILTLQQAKEYHDEIEEIYNPYINFERSHQKAEEIAKALLL